LGTFSTQEGVEKGLHQALPECLITVGGPNEVPSPALLLEKVAEGRMKSLHSNFELLHCGASCSIAMQIYYRCVKIVAVLSQN
jgi:hypothetical protein